MRKIQQLQMILIIKTSHKQAWDWVLPIKTEICLSKFFLIGTLCCNLEALKYICIVLKKKENFTFLRKITI